MDKTIKLIDVQKKKVIHVFNINMKPVYCLCKLTGKTGGYLACGAGDGSKEEVKSSKGGDTKGFDMGRSSIRKDRTRFSIKLFDVNHYKELHTFDEAHVDTII